MSATNLNNLGSKVTSRDISWSDMCQRSWGAEFRAPDHGIYRWGNGREYDSTDMGRTGIYGIQGNALLVVDGTQYPDMRDGLIASVGTVPGAADDGLGSFQEINASPTA